MWRWIGCFVPVLLFGEPHLYCQKKWGEFNWEGFRVQLLKLRAESFPAGQSYQLWIRNCDGSETKAFQYIANQKGHLIVQMSSEMKKGAPFAITPLRKGEKIAYCMLAEESKEEYEASLIPFPIRVEEKGVVLSAELSNATGRTFVLVGEGLIPGETVACRCGSSRIEMEVDGMGTFRCLLNPSIEGSESGIAQIELYHQKGSLVLPLTWGEEAQEFVGAICLKI